jgi:hypothetical protein
VAIFLPTGARAPNRRSTNDTRRVGGGEEIWRKKLGGGGGGQRTVSRLSSSSPFASSEFVAVSVRVTWDRCYDFLIIFAEKFSENIGVF